MKKTVTLCALLLGLLIVNNALAVTVDGYCYLDGETDHSGTKILFEAVTPSAVTDSTYTNADGSFLMGLSAGLYTITYSHDGRLSYTIPGDVEIFIDATLDPVTLYIGLSGILSGTLVIGHNYHVVGDISVNNGDTLIIEPGVTIKFMDYYSFTIYGTLLAAGTENDTILFTSGQPTVNPGNWNNIKFESDSDSNSVISYTKIEYSNNGIYCWYSSPTICNNMIIYNGTGDCSAGIHCYHSSPTISNNTISNNGRGINCDYSAPNISNNTINNNYYGIYCGHSSPTISNNTISNNYYGIYCGHSSPSISNNTISNNGRGINCDDSSPTILNNILYDNVRGIDANSSPSSVEYNLFWLNNTAGSGGGIPSYFGQIITVNANGDSCDTYWNLFMDPLFVNPDSLDFHLTENSPCIDAGNPDTTGLNLPPFDLDGNPRIYNGIIDIGCYEWQGVGVDDWYHSPIANVLYQNYPNPFNPDKIGTTTISFNLATKSHKNTQIIIYNLKGQLVRNFSIVNHQSSIIWDGKGDNGNQLSNGIYFYQLNTEKYSEVKKMVIIR